MLVLGTMPGPVALKRRLKINRIPRLLKKHPNIQAIFVNGKTAEQLFQRYFGGKVKLPVHTLPSTSPAHAAMNLREKLLWKILKSYSE